MQLLHAISCMHGATSAISRRHLLKKISWSIKSSNFFSTRAIFFQGCRFSWKNCMLLLHSVSDPYQTESNDQLPSGKPSWVKGPIHHAIIACNFLHARCDIRHLTSASFEENCMKQKKVETDQLFFDSSNFLQKLTLFLEKLHAIIAYSVSDPYTMQLHRFFIRIT